MTRFMGWKWDVMRSWGLAVCFAGSACGSAELGSNTQSSTPRPAEPVRESTASEPPNERPRPGAGSASAFQVPVPRCEVAERPHEIENEVATETGWIRGELLDDAVAFRGIPFAAPPVGAHRFRAPQPAACWDGVRNAREFGPRCPQLRFLGDEDCLYANVWRPRGSSETLKPVMVWIYGGANVFGSSQEAIPLSEPLYDGTYLARDGDVVVVTFNYRVGALGWLAHDALDAESLHGVSGNYGLQDQLAALHWVQRNIERFGGDPNNVTVFGESAGALNTCVLMSAPAAAGLFHRAAMQSGECSAPPMQFRKDESLEIAQRLGCDGPPDEVIDCLRSVDAGTWSAQVPLDPEVLDAWYLPWGPGVDGALLPDAPLAIIERGEHNAVPLMIGSNAHETEVFIPPMASCAGVRAFLGAALPELTDAILERYPCSDYPFSRWALVAASTDLLFTCPARRTARLVASRQDAPVFRYHYRYIRSDPLLLPLRAFHISEIGLVFGTFDRAGYWPPAHEVQLSREMRLAWARFARDGAPRTGAWSPYRPEADNLVTFDADRDGARIDRDDAFDREVCDFWAPHLP